ncbi:hypothetical protein ABPG75_004009 [Micractinium tetrahymenae]
MPAEHSQADLKRAGDEAFKHGSFAQAVEAYGQALTATAATGPAAASDPQQRGALLANRCLALLKLGGQAQQALADAQEACKLRPRWAKARLRLGQALEACGRASEAAAAFRRAAELDPELEAAAGAALAAAERRASRERCLAVLQGHRGAIYDAAVHPQAITLGSLPTRLVATAGADATVRLWCATTGSQLQLLPGHGDMVTGVAWSACGSLLASASLDGTARLWRLHRPGAGGSSAAETDAAGGGRGAGSSGSSPGQLLEALAVLSGHGGRVSCLEFSPDGALLATGTSEGQVWLRPTAASGGEGSSDAASATASNAGGTDGSGGRATGRRLGGHGGLVSSVAFSPCGRLLASASGDTTFKVWLVENGSCEADIAAESGPVNLCRFVLLPPPPAPLAWRDGAAAPPAAAAARPPPAMLLTCHVQQQRQEGRIMLWDVVQRRHGWLDGKLVGPAGTLDTFRGKVTSADSCLPGVTCSGDKSGGDNTHGSSSSNGAHPAAAAGAAGCPLPADLPGALLAAACSDGSVKLFDLAAMVDTALAQLGVPSKAAVAPLLELALPDAPASSAGASPAGGRGPAPGWGASAMQAVAHGADLCALAPDGQLLAAAGPDRRVLVVGTEGGEQQLALAGHQGAVRALRWLGPGRLLSAGEDGVARVWDAHIQIENE